MSDWPYFPEVDPRMDPDFMERLIDLRIYLGFGLPVTSSRRDKKHNKRVGGGELSAHLPDEDDNGHAVDINIFDERAFLLIKAAPQFGFTGIGIRQRGPRNKRIVHLDNAQSIPGRPRPRVWSY